MFNVIKPLSNTETRSKSKLLSNFPLKQIPGCHYGAIFDEVVVIASDSESIQLQR